MKFLIAITSMITASIAFAQKGTTSYSDNSNQVLNFNLGMTSSALNVGVRLDTSKTSGAFGGYFFLQTEKRDAGVGQIAAFGAHTSLRIIDTNSIHAYLAPGAGIAMVKGGTGDTTVVGPSIRLGAQFKLNNGGAIGVERLEFWNWFDSKTASDVAYTSAVYSMSFR